MNMQTLTTTDVAIIVFLALLLAAGAVIWLLLGRRRTKKLRYHFGDAEYFRAVKDSGSRHRAEASLEKRAQRLKELNIRPLAPVKSMQFIAVWNTVQSRFVDGPGVAVAEAGELLAEVMSARGYPPSDFEQRAEDISLAYPAVLESYRTAHASSVRYERGEADTEELRRAFLLYRQVFDELVGHPDLAQAPAAALPAFAASAAPREAVRAGRMIGAR